MLRIPVATLALAAIAAALLGCRVGTPLASATQPIASGASPTRSTSASPSEPPPVASSETGAKVALTSDVSYTQPVDCPSLSSCVLQLDVIAPPTGTAHPVVVLVPGAPAGPGNRTAVGATAVKVAKEGAVVFLADYRGPGTGIFPDPIDDIACAVRFAAAHAAEYGGDPTRLTLVGHSLGGTMGLLVALGAPTTADSCLASAGDGRPGRFIGLGGDVALDPASDAYRELLGTSSKAAWRRVQPETYVANHLPVTVRLAYGTLEDSPTQEGYRTFAHELQTAGYDAASVPIEHTDHLGLVALGGPGSAAVVDLIGTVAQALPAVP